MLQLVFMVEEPSMEETLKSILPKIIPEESYNPIIIPHSGKNDLKKSIPRKLKAWKDNENIKYKFIILMDQDRAECKEIKNKLKILCVANNRPDCIIRIVCRELESWFLGDLIAIQNALNISIPSQKKKKFRDPDKLGNPSEEIQKLCQYKYRKLDNARKISRNLSINENSSHSFNVFVSTVRNIFNNN